MKNRYKLLLQKGVWMVLFLFSVLSFNSQVYGQYVHTDGTQIVDEYGDDIYFSGMNLGNWLIWEGYLMMDDLNFRTHTGFFNSVKDAFGGDLGKAAEFEHQWRLNYVTAQGIADLKELGYNSVRVPFHFNLFWDYGTYAPTNRGFEYLDRVINYCRDNDMYVLLDMHAAPGYQNPGDHSDNVNSNANQPRESVTFWDYTNGFQYNVDVASQVWGHIAKYYKDEPVIWGYDLINEPVPQAGREYELLPSMIAMRDAIRAEDNNHIIVAEGSWWGAELDKLDWTNSTVIAQTGISSRWDNNLVFQTHHYSNDASALNARLAICDNLNIPMILGEYGETDNTYIRDLTDWCIDNNVGYFPWSFKKMSKDRCLWTIQPNAPYNELKAFINNGTTPSSNLYNDLISFAQNNIANGSSPALTFHQGWYDATKPPSLGFVPDPSKTYYIDRTDGNYRLAASGSSESAYTTSTSTTGNDVEWKFVAKGNGYWHLDRAAGGSKRRLRSDNTQYADMQNIRSKGGWTYYDFAPGHDEGTYFLTLPDGPSNYKRLQVTNTGDIKMVSTGSTGTWESFTITEVNGNGNRSLTDDETVNGLVQNKSEVLIYPNPVLDGQFTIDIGEENFDSAIVLSMINILGKSVYQVKLNQGVNQLSLSSNVNAGVYIVHISDGTKVKNSRIVIK